MNQESSSSVSAEYGHRLRTISDFQSEYRHLYPREARLRWLIRDRASNGLLDYSAVVELWNGGARPRLYIDPSRWFAWIRAGGSRAPKQACT